MRSTHVARGLISAAAVVVLLSLACGGSNTGRPSNLTDEQMARLQDFAEGVEREGNLRPALPAYVPPGVDPSPVIIDKSEQHIVFAFLGTSEGASEKAALEKAAVPLSLSIEQQFAPLSLPLLCGDESSLEDDELLLPGGHECVRVGEHPADLQTTEDPDGTVIHEIWFELGDLDITMGFFWKRGQDASPETEEQMKQEVLRVATSMTAP